MFLLYYARRSAKMNIPTMIIKTDNFIAPDKARFHPKSTGPSYLKLTMSLVNDSLKFTSSDTQIC